jgi:hypothetical protein
VRARPSSPHTPGRHNVSGSPARPARWQPPTVPVGRPVAPPPLPTNSKPSWLSKLLALAALAAVSLAVGAFLLPGQRRRPAAPEPSSAPARQDVEVAEAPQPAASEVVSATGGEPEAETEVTAGRPSTFDLPRVEPKLPGGGAFDLAATIDREVGHALAAAGVPASPLAGDAEFLRRAHLDLTGRIPSRDQAVRFLDSTDPYKRSKLIDELLAEPEYGRHFARIWTDLLVKRDFDNNKNLRSGPFTDWLAEQFNKDRPWDQIVADLLTAKGSEEQSPATFFLLANQDNQQPSPSKLVGASANLFMGIQLQCAECHVHPFTSKWEQKDFWGLAAFFGHTRAERAGGKAKKATGPATIVEVDRAEVRGRGKGNKANNARPILAGPSIAIPDPTDPRKTVKVVPARYFESRKAPPSGQAPYRPALAAWLASAEDPYFAPAAVNRTWAHLFARGLVNPVDDMNDQNVPSHPELLRALAEEFTKSRYDLKYLLRAICNSRAYQRSSRPLPGNTADEKLLSHMSVKVMDAPVLLASLAVATGHQEKEPARPRMVKGAGKGNFRGGDSLVRFFDTREYDADPAEFSYGVPQVLRLMNSALSNSGTETARRLVGQHGDEPERILEEIYLAALSRRPRPAEAARMAEYVAGRPDPIQGYAGVFWALLNSAEFVSVR